MQAFIYPECPLTVPKLRYLKFYIRFPLQNKSTGLANGNSLADSVIYRNSRSQMFFRVT